MQRNPGSLITVKGFTDHEHMDSVGLIHMNGRVYDPELGRFMSADPFVQAPYNSQSYNRYSYVFNNPLSFTDPSGYACDNQNAGNSGGDCDSDVEELPVTCDWTCQNAHQTQSQLDAINASNIANWRASENRGEQWSYMNGAAYNIANFWGKVAFDLAAGVDSSTNNNGSYFSYDNWRSQQNFMQTNPWDGAVWATGYNIDQQMTKVMSGMASFIPVGRASGAAIEWGGRLFSAKGLAGNALFKSALGQYKNTQFTNAGRSVTKHPEYFGFKNTEALRKIYNTEAKINKLAADTLKDIMRTGNTTTGAGGRYPNGWKTMTASDGRAASWHSNGNFIGFRGVE